jgi:predicted nucleic acid-binding protein
VARIRPDQAEEIACSLPRFFDQLIVGVGLAERAVSIAIQRGHPVYDCFYLALAEQRRATLLTADERLLRKLRGTPWQGAVIGLGDYTGASGGEGARNR